MSVIRKEVVPLQPEDVRFLEDISRSALIIAIEEVFQRERVYRRFLDDLGLPPSVAWPMADTIRLWSLRKTLFPRVPITLRPGRFAGFHYQPEKGSVLVTISGAPPLEVPFDRPGYAILKMVVWWKREDDSLLPFATIHSMPIKAGANELNEEAFALAVHVAILLRKFSPYCRDKRSLVAVIRLLTGVSGEVAREIATVAVNHLKVKEEGDK